MKKRNVIAVVLVVVLLCASFGGFASASSQCPHTYSKDYRCTTDSIADCDDDPENCRVRTICVTYDFYCPTCEYIGYAEDITRIHSGFNCFDEHTYDEYFD